jgi:uncharacterized protein YndB with AHSA1/START domain
VTRITLVRLIAASPETVFKALTTPEGIKSWWGPDDGPVLLAEVDARVGGRFRIRFRQSSGSEHECSGEYLEVALHKRLVMSWRWLGGAEDPGVSRLVFDIRPTEAGVELTLTHSHLHSDETRDTHEHGWSGALDKLQANFQIGA